MRKDYLIFMTAIVSGFSIFINKFGVSFPDAYVYTFINNFAVALFFVGIVLMSKTNIKNITKKHWTSLVLIGLIGGGIPFLMFFKGLSLTTAAKGSFIHKTMFLFVAMMAFKFLGEKFNWKFYLGSAALIVGNALLLKLVYQPFNSGDILILGATLLWAVENTLSKKLLNDIAPNVLGMSRMFFGSVFIFTFLGLTSNLNFALTTQQWLWSLVPSALLLLYVLFWYNGLKDVPVTLATSILALGSPITTLLNFSVGTTMTLAQGIGIVGIAIGVLALYHGVEIAKPSKVIV